YNAPFGRPRQQPVAREIIRVNIQTTVYPGSKGPPTRHGFGSHWEPMVLNGRWMTRFMIPGQTAIGMADRWTEFVRDEQPIQMSWNNIASWQGIIEELELARESENDIAWKMTVLVDTREDSKPLWGTAPPFSAVSAVESVKGSVHKITTPPTDD